MDGRCVNGSCIWRNGGPGFIRRLLRASWRLWRAVVTFAGLLCLAIFVLAAQWLVNLLAPIG
jgi:hypothetical protein